MGPTPSSAREKSLAVITGIGLRIPDANNLNELTNLLNSQRSVLRDPRWLPGLYGMDHHCGLVTTVGLTDCDFFNISQQEACNSNPMLGILLEVIAECILDSGLKFTDISQRKTGCYMGITFCDTDILKTSADSSSDFLNTRSELCARVSQQFDLKGPVMQMDGACASSFAAMHSALMDIQAKRCDLAIVVGSNLVLDPIVSLQFARMNMLSPTGESAPFDESANGYVRADSVVALLLKPADADITSRVYCDVVGFGLHSDGAKPKGIINPSHKSQSYLLTETYTRHNIDPNDIVYYEAHGTSTQKGDKAELSAIDNILCSKRNEPLTVGSIKGNIGHAEAAAGMAGISKCLASFQSQTIFGNINFRIPNKTIKALKTGTIVIPTSSTPWPKDRIGLMSISSFGFGGLAGHIILRPCPFTSQETVTHPILIPLSLHPLVDVKLAADEIKKRMSDASFLHYLLKSELCGGTANPHRTFIIAQPSTNSVLFSTCHNTDMTVKQLCTQFVDCLSAVWVPNPNILNLPVVLASLQLSEKVLMSETKRCGSLLSALRTNNVPLPMEPNGLTLRVACQIAVVDLLRKLNMLSHLHAIQGIGLGSIAAAYADECLTRNQCLQIAQIIECALIEENNMHSDTTLLKVHLDLDQLYQLGPWIRILHHQSSGGSLIAVLQNKGDDVVKTLNDKGVVFEEQDLHIPVYSSLLKHLEKSLLQTLKKVIPSPVMWSARAEIPKLKQRGDMVKMCDAHFFMEVLTTPLSGDKADDIASSHTSSEIIGTLKASCQSSLPTPAVSYAPRFGRSSSSETGSSGTNSSETEVNCSMRATRGSLLSESPFFGSSSLSRDAGQKDNTCQFSVSEDDSIFREHDLQTSIVASDQLSSPVNMCETLVLSFFMSEVGNTNLCLGTSSPGQTESKSKDNGQILRSKCQPCCLQRIRVPATDIGILNALGHVHVAGHICKAEMQVEDPEHPKIPDYSGDFPTHLLWAWHHTGQSSESDWRLKPGTGKHRMDIFKMEFPSESIHLFEMPGLCLIPPLFKLVTRFLDDELTGGKVLVFHQVKLVEAKNTVLPHTEIGKTFGRIFHQSSKFCVEKVGSAVLKGSYEILARNPAARSKRNVCSSVAMNSPEEMLKNLFIIYKHFFDETFPFRLLWDPLRHKTVLMEALKKLKQRKKNVQISCSVDPVAGIIMCGGFILHSQCVKPQRYKLNYSPSGWQWQSFLGPPSISNSLSPRQTPSAFYECFLECHGSEEISHSSSSGISEERISDEKKINKQVRFSGHHQEGNLKVKEEIHLTREAEGNEIPTSENDPVRAVEAVKNAEANVNTERGQMEKYREHMREKGGFSTSDHEDALEKELKEMPGKSNCGSAEQSMPTNLTHSFVEDESVTMKSHEEKMESPSCNSTRWRDAPKPKDKECEISPKNAQHEVSIADVLPEALALTKGENFSFVQSLDMSQMSTNTLESILYQFPLSTTLQVYIVRKGLPSNAAPYVLNLFYNGTDCNVIEGVSILLRDRSSGLIEACSSTPHALSVVSTFVSNVYTHFVAHVYAVMDTAGKQASPTNSSEQMILAKEKLMLDAVLSHADMQIKEQSFDFGLMNQICENDDFVSISKNSSTKDIPKLPPYLRNTSYSLNIDGMLAKSLTKLVAVNGQMIAYVVPQTLHKNLSRSENSSETSNTTLTRNGSGSPVCQCNDGRCTEGKTTSDCRGNQNDSLPSISDHINHWRERGLSGKPIHMLSIGNRNWDSETDGAKDLPVFMYGTTSADMTKLSSVNELVTVLKEKHPDIDKTHEICAAKVSESDCFDDLLFSFWNESGHSQTESDTLNKGSGVNEDIGQPCNLYKNISITSDESKTVSDVVESFSIKNIIGMDVHPSDRRNLPKFCVYPVVESITNTDTRRFLDVPAANNEVSSTKDDNNDQTIANETAKLQSAGNSERVSPDSTHEAQFDDKFLDRRSSCLSLCQDNDYSIELNELRGTSSEIIVAPSSEDTSGEREVYEILHNPPLLIYSEDSSSGSTSSPNVVLTRRRSSRSMNLSRPDHESLGGGMPAGLENLNTRVAMAMCVRLMDHHTPVAQQVGRTSGNLMLYGAKDKEKETDRKGSTYLGLLLIDEFTLRHVRFHLPFNMVFSHVENVVHIMIAMYILEELGHMGDVRKKTVLIQAPLIRDSAIVMLLASRLQCKQVITSSTIPAVRENLKALMPNAIVLSEPASESNVFSVTEGRGCDIVVMFHQEELAQYLDLVAVSGSLVICGKIDSAAEIGMRSFLRNLSIHSVAAQHVIRHYMTLEPDKQQEFEKKLAGNLLQLNTTITREYPAENQGHFHKMLSQIKDLAFNSQPDERALIHTFMSKTQTSSQVIASVDREKGQVLHSLHESLTSGFFRENAGLALRMGDATPTSYRKHHTGKGNGTDQSAVAEKGSVSRLLSVRDHHDESVDSVPDITTPHTPRVRVMSCRRYSDVNIGHLQTLPSKDVTPHKRPTGPEVPVLVKRGFQPTTALQDMVNSRETSTIVKLNENSLGIPLFIVHPVMGTVTCFNQLAKRLRIPVYGIQCTNQALLTSEEGVCAVAKYYLEEMEKEYPEGPLYLGGYSLGAVIAHEMASVLEASGRLKKMIFLDGAYHYSCVHLDYEMEQIPSGRSYNTNFFCAVLLSFIRLYLPDVSSSNAAAVLLALDTREKQIEMAVDISLGYVKLDFNYRPKEAWHMISDRIRKKARLDSFKESIASNRSRSLSCSSCRSVPEEATDEPESENSDTEEPDEALSNSDTVFHGTENSPTCPHMADSFSQHKEELRETIPELFIAEPASTLAETSERVLFLIRKQKAQMFLQLGLMLQNHEPAPLTNIKCVLLRVKDPPRHLADSDLGTQYGLQDLVNPENLQVYFIDGNHQSCLQTPHVVHLARLFAHVCKD